MIVCMANRTEIAFAKNWRSMLVVIIEVVDPTHNRRWTDTRKPTIAVPSWTTNTHSSHALWLFLITAAGLNLSAPWGKAWHCIPLQQVVFAWWNWLSPRVIGSCVVSRHYSWLQRESGRWYKYCSVIHAQPRDPDSLGTQPTDRWSSRDLCMLAVPTSQ